MGLEVGGGETEEKEEEEKFLLLPPSNAIMTYLSRARVPLTI